MSQTLTHSKSDTELVRTACSHVIIDTSDGESSHDAPSCDSDGKKKINGEVTHVIRITMSCSNCKSTDKTFINISCTSPSKVLCNSPLIIVILIWHLSYFFFFKHMI